MDDGNVITCSRTIGVIYYLTKDWQPEEGGNLVDMEDPAGQLGQNGCFDQGRGSVDLSHHVWEGASRGFEYLKQSFHCERS